MCGPRVGARAETHAWLREVDARETADVQAGLDANPGATLRHSTPQLAPEQTAICRQLPGRIGDIVARLNEPPRTVTHHDYRADNLFFRRDGSVVAVDWEGLTRQRGGFDVGMFLRTSLRKDAFAAHGPGLIDSYASSVQRAGFAYPPDQFQRDVRLGVLLQLVWACYVLSDPVLGTGRPLRVVESWMDRLAHAAIGLDAFGALRTG